MADSVAAPVVTPQPPSELSVFIHKVLYAHVGIFILTLALVGAGGYFGLRSYDKALAHANALQAQFNTEHKALTDLLAQDTQARAQESAQQAALVEAITKRNAAPLPVAVQTALKPDASAENVITGLQSVYNFPVAPLLEPDGNIAVNVPNAQQELSAKVEANRLSGDLVDETSLYTLETAKSTSLSNDLQQCTVTVADAQKTIAAFKKAAHRSLFRRILGKAETVALVVAAFELGHKL